MGNSATLTQASFEKAWKIWSPYAQQAMNDGWTISDCYGTENGTPWQLQALNEAEVFADDNAAWLHVVTNARNGDALAIKALEFLRDFSPKEYEYISNRVGTAFL